jgi:hypothetical protein
VYTKLKFCGIIARLNVRDVKLFKNGGFVMKENKIILTGDRPTRKITYRSFFWFFENKSKTSK